MLRLARHTQKDYRVLARSTQRAQVVTIPYSHFCELGNWALTACRVPCDEHGFAPGAHVLPALALRFAGGAKHLATSSAVRPVKPVEAQLPDPPRSGKPNPTAVPVCALPDGTVLVDSWSIVDHAASAANLAPVPDPLRAVLDAELGPKARQIAYSHLFKPEAWDVWSGLCTENGGALWRCAWALGGGRMLTEKMTKLFRSDDPAATDKCKEELRAVFARVEREHLSSLGKAKPWLGGKSPGLADVALAALAAPVLSPPDYCAGKYAKWFDLLLERDAALREETEAWRATAVGRHALKVYAACRREPLVAFDEDNFQSGPSRS